MKRSVMIREIMDILEEDCDPRYTDITYYDLAQSILNKMERLGIGPPINGEERKWETE